MNGLKRLGGAAIVTALMVQASSASAANFCVTDSEARAVGLFMAPDLLRALANTCRPQLPANAYLARPSEMLTARYTAAGSKAWPEVQALVARVPDAKILRGLDEKAVRTMIASVLEDKALGKIKPGECATANEVLMQLDPLPPENLISLVITFGKMAEKDQKQPAGSKTPKTSQIFCDAGATPGK